MASSSSQTTSKPSSSSSPLSSSANPLPLTPIIFCGPGSNLYPLCDPSSSSTSTQVSTTSLPTSLPKSLLPIANRPLISFPLQQLVSAGIKYAIVLAPINQHKAIENALKSVRLQVPNTTATSGTTSTPYLPFLASGKQQESNIAVYTGIDNPTKSSTGGSSSSAGIDIRVHLLPLGPYDTLGFIGDDDQVVEKEDESESDQDDDAQSSAEDERNAFRRISRPGTAELLRWLDSIGKLEFNPLILPVDFIAPSIPLSSFLLSYYSSCKPSPPTISTLLYERGAGETVGRDREKEGPPTILTAYSSKNQNDTTVANLLTSHDLLLLSEPPTSSNSSSSYLDVRLSLLKSFPQCRFTTNLLDAHTYILRKDQVIPLLKARKDFTSLKEHVIPFIAKAGWQQGLMDKSGWRQSIRTEVELQNRMRFASDDNEQDQIEYGDENNGGEDGLLSGKRGDLMKLAFQRSSLGNNYNSNNRSNEVIRATTVVARLNGSTPTLVPSLDAPQPNSSTPEEERFFARANTLATYLECNRFMLRALSFSGSSNTPLYFPLPSLLPSSSNNVQVTAGGSAAMLTSTPDSYSSSTDSSSTVRTIDISTSSQLSTDTLLPLSEPIYIGDRTSIKKSLLSHSIKLNKGCKISGSIIMENVQVGEFCKLENCIIGPGVVIADKCVLKDVDIGPCTKIRKVGAEFRFEKIGRGEQDSDEEEDKSGESQEESGEESD
ncbi:unnamed protein product [Sympodiomycopsis kandeliae]